MIIPETYFSVEEQLTLFGSSILFGAAFGVLYDAFRAIRLALPHNRVLVIIEDLLFLLFYAVFIVAFSSAAARGEFRFYFVLGNIIGFTIYYLTVGNIVIKVIRSIIKIIYSFFSVALRPFKLIYALVYRKIKEKFVTYTQKVKKINKNKKRHLIECPKMLYNNRVKKIRKNVNNVGKKK